MPTLRPQRAIRSRISPTPAAVGPAITTPAPGHVKNVPGEHPPACRETLVRVPLVPQFLLAKHHCLIVGDTRYRAALRLRQSIWGRAQGLLMGQHRTSSRQQLAPVPLGSLLTPADAARGLNFANSEVFAFARRTMALREEGACLSLDRLLRNMLSSEALTFNAFGPLALDLNLASAVFRQLLPALVDRVTGFTFETAPARRTAHDPNDRFLADRSAFDLAVHVIGPSGTGTVFVEVKLTEACQGPAAAHRARYEEATREVGLYRDPEDPALRSVALEQFKRLHVLSQLAVRHGVTPRGHLLVLYPRLNRDVHRATQRYAATLLDQQGTANRVGFGTLTLEDFVASLTKAGAAAQAIYLQDRFLDLRPVLDLVLDPNNLASEAIAPAATGTSQPDTEPDTVSFPRHDPVPANAPRRRSHEPTATNSATRSPSRV